MEKLGHGEHKQLVLLFNRKVAVNTFLMLFYSIWFLFQIDFMLLNYLLKNPKKAAWKIQLRYQKNNLF